MKYFDEEYYALIYPEYKEVTSFPLVHYVTIGWRQGYNPSPEFNTIFYLSQMINSSQNNSCPLEHYLKLNQDDTGRFMIFPEENKDDDMPQVLKEHREDILFFRAWQYGIFDYDYYRRNNNDINCDPLKHYRQYGWRENRMPSEFFNVNNYRTYSSTVPLHENPLVDFMLKLTNNLGRNLKREAKDCELFDEDYYIQSYPELGLNKNNAFAHYLLIGWREGRNPAPFFNTSYCISQMNGCLGNPLIYLLTQQNVAEIKRFPTVAEISTASREVFKQLGEMAAFYLDREHIFDADWYRAQYVDVADYGQNPLDHYRKYGFAEGRKPCKEFDANWYANTYIENGDAGISLTHYLLEGQFCGNILIAPEKIRLANQETSLLYDQIKQVQIELEKCVLSKKQLESRDKQIINELESKIDEYKVVVKEIDDLKTSYSNIKNKYDLAMQIMIDQLSLCRNLDRNAQ